VHVSMSIGVSHWQITNPVSADELVRHADEAMYKAKSDPDHCVVLSELATRSAA
jgi:GGDEF domain-containing protein